MPVRKLRSLDEAEQSVWLAKGDPRLWRAVKSLWEFSDRVHARRFPPGAHRHRTIEDANLKTEEWERLDLHPRFRLVDDDEAIAAFEETVHIDPTHQEAWQHLAVLYEKTGSGKKAVDASVGRCQTRPYEIPVQNHRLVSDQPFVYPSAPLAAGGMGDLRMVPDPPNSMDHSGCVFDPARRLGFVTAINLEKRMMLDIWCAGRNIRGCRNG